MKNKHKGNSEYFKGTHRLSRHPLYSLWSDVKNRCYRPQVQCYQYYGGRGVTMCEEWKNSFVAFYNWAMANGWQKGLQLDKDIKAGKLGVPGMIYSPDFCQFVSKTVNARNTSTNVFIKYNGETKSMAEWAEVYNFPYKLLHQRLVRDGLTLEEAIVKPIRERQHIVINVETGIFYESVKEAWQSYGTQSRSYLSSKLSGSRIPNNTPFRYA